MYITAPQYDTTRTYAPYSPRTGTFIAPLAQPAMREYPVVAPAPYGIRDPQVTRQPVMSPATMNGAASSAFGMQGFRTIYQQG